MSQLGAELSLLLWAQIFLRPSERTKIDASHLENGLLNVVPGAGPLAPGLDGIDGLVLEPHGFDHVGLFPGGEEVPDWDVEAHEVDRG